MSEIAFRTLRHEYRLHCPDQNSTDAMAFMAITPDMPRTRLEVVEFPLEVDQGYFRVRDPSGGTAEGDTIQVLNLLHALIFADLLQSEVGCPIIHCGTLVNPFKPGGRIAVLGGKGLGKTTLMLALLEQGFQVEGDEHLVLREHEVIARPRTLRVKSGSLCVVPALADVIRNGPSVTTWQGERIYAFAPKQAGFKWAIEPGTLDHVIVLSSNHGGRSLIQWIDPELALRRAVEQLVLPQQGRAQAFARLRAKILAAQCHCLRIDQLAQVGDLIKRHISQLA